MTKLRKTPLVIYVQIRSPVELEWLQKRNNFEDTFFEEPSTHSGYRGTWA